MVDYSDRHDAFMTAAYPKQIIVNTLGRMGRRTRPDPVPHRRDREISACHLLPERRQGDARGGRGCATWPQSPKVATYDLQPEMSSVEVTDHLVAAIQQALRPDRGELRQPRHGRPYRQPARRHRRLRGGGPRRWPASLEALETAGGAMIVTADHGNCETMVDPVTGRPHTSHTTNPVPVILVGGPGGRAAAQGPAGRSRADAAGADGSAAAARDDRKEPDRRDDARALARSCGPARWACRAACRRAGGRRRHRPRGRRRRCRPRDRQGWMRRAGARTASPR